MGEEELTYQDIVDRLVTMTHEEIIDVCNLNDREVFLEAISGYIEDNITEVSQSLLSEGL